MFRTANRYKICEFTKFMLWDANPKVDILCKLWLVLES